MNEIATMDDLKSKITDRIKNSFVELIPEEVWKELVDKEIEKFTKPQGDRYNTRCPEIESLIHAELKRRFELMIKEDLDKQNLYGNDGKMPAFISEVVKESAPALIEALFGEVVMRAVVSIKNQMGQGY